MPQNQCPLLALPPELRLQIYTHLFSTNPCEPLLILRTNTTIQQPLHRWFPHPSPSLLLTCRKIHFEATPILYSTAYFRFKIYIGDGWPKFQHAGPLDGSSGLLRRMRHVDVTLQLVDAGHIEPAVERLGVLAKALEEAKAKAKAEGGSDGEEGAELKTLKVTFKAVTSYNMAVTRDLVARHRDLALRKLQEEEGTTGERGNVLFRRMLMEGDIVAIQPG